MTLTRNQRRQVKEAFNDAFRTKAKLQQFVKDELDKNLDSIALGDDLEELISKLIENADSRGWETQLIFAARESNPDNPKLSAFLRVYEIEYWQQLAQKANSYELEEVDANNAIVEVEAQVVRVIESQPNLNDELMQKLEAILEKLNQPETPVAAKAMLTLPLIPGILSYEVELDTENSLRRAFDPIKKLYKRALEKK
ncbi:effector-associated domain EAD1-containing protein [Microcoleus sp. herbarium8]|uniref:effector-associated domain EAD1-containing protein n=1 Tax=Microcoleus sp. herbarium8 TaxID=3055436 RepID=UPI002FCFF8CB